MGAPWRRRCSQGGTALAAGGGIGPVRALTFLMALTGGALLSPGGSGGAARRAGGAGALFRPSRADDRAPQPAAFHRRAAGGARRARGADEQIAVLCIDLDGLREINDLFGHGERRRRRSCAWPRTLGRLAGEDALVARLSGDKFAVARKATPSAR